MTGRLTAQRGERNLALKNTDVAWAIRTSMFLLVAHALAYMTHELSHSTLAWALGWMRSPLALDYGGPTLGNLTLLTDVSDNVNYDPIFATGHGLEAAAIALAGPFIGNGLLYVLVYLLARRLPSRGPGQSFAFCLSLMGAGNLWSYVPIRTLTTHADMALAAQGLEISTWQLLPFVLVPTLAITWHFLARACLRWWFPLLAGSSDTRYAFLCAVTPYWFFVFFGESARSGSYGSVSQALSFLSVYLLFPLSAALLWSAGATPIRADPVQRLS